MPGVFLSAIESRSLMPRVAVLLTPMMLAAGIWAAAPSNAQSGTSGQILFWAASKPFVESWVSKVPSADTERFSRLRAMFTGQGCTHLEEEPVGNHAGSNLICTLPGHGPATILVVAHFEHPGKGAGAVENWSGAAMLPLLLHALSATPRNYTFVFAALDGAKGASTFMNNRRATRRQFRAMFALEDLGLSPSKYCAFNWAPLQEFGLAQFLSDASALVHPGAPPERTGCDRLKIDDTRVFRQADIPALIIHSVTLSERSLPGSAADTAAAIQGDSYYESYQLMATYLAALDRVLEQALNGGQVASSAILATGSEERPINGSGIAPPATTPTPNGKPSPILVDVVVTDKRGAPVAHLRREDFAVLEDHRTQTITAFEEHPVSVAPPIAPTAPPDSFTNAPPAQPPDAVNILLLDRLNTPPDGSLVDKPMTSYLKTIPPGMHLAVFGLGSRLWTLEEASANSSLGLGTIDAKDPKPSLGPAASIGNGSLSGRQSRLEVNLRAFQSDTPGFPFDVRTRLTLAAFQQLARSLSGIPGRKNVVWFSRFFPLSSQALAFAPEAGSAPRHETDEDYATLLRPTLDLLASARVTIYPVDSRGVRPPTPFMTAPGLGDEHHAMKLLAESTGGEAFYDTDQLKEALERIETTSEHYYTLAYQPTSAKLDGRFHRIVVRLNDANYRLNYRRGYYADIPVAAPATDQLDPTLEAALAPGIPPATQILLTVRATPPASQSPPGSIHYTLVYAANPQGVLLDEGADHQRHGHLIFAAAAYDANDKAINAFWHALQLDLDPAQYLQAQTSGIFFQKEFEVPEGAAALRVGVYDPASGRMGTLDIPLTPAVAKP
jgi:VWFA-related protein